MENDPAVALHNRGKTMDVPMDAPSVSCQEQDMVVDRATAEYENDDKPFRIAQRNYERQYAQLYFARLQKMSGSLKEAVARKWPGTEMVKILDVGGREEGKPCCVIGTIYKDQKLKPSILDEYTKDRGMQAALAATSFCSDEDSVALEDEGGRMLLKGDPAHLPVQQLVTGVVVAIRGENQLGGAFVAHEVLYPDMAAQPPRPQLQDDKYCAIMSGLRFSSAQADMMQRKLALDMLSGELGGEEEQALAARVVRLIIAGGCLGNLDSMASASTNTYGRQQTISIQPIRDFDTYLSEVAGAVPVDVMPGPEDPANVALPQQPLHRCLVPHAAAMGSMVPATNPHAFKLDGVHFLGSSGQPVEDMAKYSVHKDRLAVLEHCLRWRHMAPTAPDTLATYPFHDDDPFILHETPHVFFAGNQPEFATRTVLGSEGQEVRVVCVPSFSRTGVIVMVNLRTLEAWPLRVLPLGSTTPDA